MADEPNSVSLILAKNDVCARLNISSRGLENMIREGRFPEGVRVGKRVYWSDRALHAWLTRVFGAQEKWRP
jgi:predicted DNA-binding transcriptional regulator AlpA